MESDQVAHIETFVPSSAEFTTNPHVDSSHFYASRQTLHSIRTILLFVSSMHYWNDLFTYGWKWLPLNLKYFTFWGKSLVQFYLLWVVVYYPKSKKMSNFTLVAQHTILICETYIFLMYWLILSPHKDWKESFAYENGIYPHFIVFLFILHEFSVTYGEYGSRGEIGGIIIISVYMVWSIYLKVWQGIDVYKLPVSDPREWDWKVCLYIFINFCVILMVGRVYRVLKNIMVDSARRKVYEELKTTRTGEGEERGRGM